MLQCTQRGALFVVRVYVVVARARPWRRLGVSPRLQLASIPPAPWLRLLAPPAIGRCTTPAFVASLVSTLAKKGGALGTPDRITTSFKTPRMTRVTRVKKKETGRCSIPVRDTPKRGDTCSLFTAVPISEFRLFFTPRPTLSSLTPPCAALACLDLP